MPSRDILDRLLGVERNAESILATAKEESERRLGAAKERAEKSFKSDYEARARALEEDFGTARKGAEEAFRAELESYRTRLEASVLDESAFIARAKQFLELGK